MMGHVCRRSSGSLRFVSGSRPCLESGQPVPVTEQAISNDSFLHSQLRDSDTIAPHCIFEVICVFSDLCCAFVQVLQLVWFGLVWFDLVGSSFNASLDSRAPPNGPKEDPLRKPLCYLYP